MWQFETSQRKSGFTGVLFTSLLLGASVFAAESKVETSSGESSDAAAWEQVLGQPASELNLQNQPVETKKMSMDDVKVEPKAIMDGVKTKSSGMSKDDRKGGYVEEPVEKYLEVSPPPANVSKIVDIYLENKSKAQGFLTGFTTKRADIDLKLQQHQPSNIPLDSKFQVANFGNYIRLGHELTGNLIGYSTNYFGFTSVYLEKDYYQSDDFWSRFKIAPSGQEDWYLIRSYTDPKKCLTIGWSQKLRLKRCNIQDKWQQWRFLREKADAYWVPDSELIDLDII